MDSQFLNLAGHERRAYVARALNLPADVPGSAATIERLIALRVDRGPDAFWNEIRQTTGAPTVAQT